MTSRQEEVSRATPTFTFRDVTVVISLVWVRRVAPGSLVIIVWIPAVILLQSVIGVCVGGIAAG